MQAGEVESFFAEITESIKRGEIWKENRKGT